KLARYSPAMRSLLDVLYNERRALFGCFVILLGATLLAASVMHVIEGHAQPDKFGTIPDAMWWAIVTLGTIGYGDVVPVTVPGRIVASVTIFVGFIMVALPIGIVATAFADEIHRRDFVVKPARARCPRPARPHGAGTPHRGAYPGSGSRPSGRRRRHAKRRSCRRRARRSGDHPRDGEPQSFVRGGGQGDNTTQTGLAVRSPRVTPPKIHSPNRLCP